MAMNGTFFIKEVACLSACKTADATSFFISYPLTTLSVCVTAPSLLTLIK